MKQINKILILLTIIFTNLNAAPVGTLFNYQGQLNLGGSPANGSYDFKMELWTQLTGGTNIPAQIYEDIVVENGLFTIELDFGDTPFVGDAKFLQIQVRDGASTGGFEQLSPRQSINNVPYAIQSAFVENNTSPWSIITGGIGYADDVKIGNTGTTTSSMLTVDADISQSPIRFKINGATKMIVNANGGTSIGVNTTPPANGLRVDGNSKLVGDTELKGDLKQDVENNGSIKAGLSVFCSNSSPAVNTSFNGVNTGTFTMPAGSDAGSCRITFPFNLDNRFYIAMYKSSSSATAERRLVTCKQESSGSSNLDCVVTNSSGIGVNSFINIIVY